MVKESGINDEYEGQAGLGELGDKLNRNGISVTYTRQTNNEKILDIVNQLIEKKQ